MSEKIVKDLMSSGNDSVDSLLGMLKKYKRAQKNAQDEIEKLTKLDLVKENELVSLNQELEVLHQVQAQEVENFERRFDNAVKTVEENRNIIKRQDKLIVDLQQKNEVCQIRITQTEEDIHKKNRETSTLEMKMKEIADKRKQLGTGISKMEQQLRAYREYLVFQQQRDNEMLDAAAKKAIKRTQDDKKFKKSKNSLRADLQSNKSGQISDRL